MAKKKTAVGLPAGTRIRVRPGVMSPEFPDISIAGWTGEVTESTGKPPELSYIIQWDQPTRAAMPPEYVQRCEEQQLFLPMAKLAEADVETLM